MAAVAPPAVIVVPIVPEIDQIREILTWIGFQQAIERENIINDAFRSYDDIQALTVKDISDLNDTFGRRTATNGRINFGIRRTKKLKSMVHWSQDFKRISYTPSIAGLTETLFLKALLTASERADVREQLVLKMDVKAKEASPGPLVSENKWTEWEPKFENYLSTVLGMNGIPLSYVIRRNELPIRSNTYCDFTEECITCTPLSGVAYEADRSTVHQSLVSFTTGQPSEDWLKPKAKFKDGRKSMQALRDHFSGEGNASRRVAEADRMKDTLHYKNERSLPFETFLTKVQKMYNIYELHGEEMSEDAKIRFLFKKINHDGLSNAVEAMKAKITTEAPGTVTYTTVCNHIGTAVSELPDYISRNRSISGVSHSDDGGRNAGGSIYNADGSINTGHHPNWNKGMSDGDKKIVNDERARLGLGRNKKTNPRSKARAGRPSATSSNQMNQLAQLKKANAKHKRTIAGLQTGATTTVSEDVDMEDASDAFGGKSKKVKNNK